MNIKNITKNLQKRPPAGETSAPQPSPEQQLPELLELLASIDPNAEDILLSNGLIQDMGIDALLRYTGDTLRNPIPEAAHLGEVLVQLGRSLDILQAALRDSLEPAAESAAIAVLCITGSLQLRLGALDREYAEQMLSGRLVYAQTLSRIAEHRMDLDHLTREIGECHARLSRLLPDLEHRKHEYQQRRMDGELDKPLEELQRYGHLGNSGLGQQALALREELLVLHDIKGAVDAEIKVLGQLEYRQMICRDKLLASQDDLRGLRPVSQDPHDMSLVRLRAHLRSHIRTAARRWEFPADLGRALFPEPQWDLPADIRQLLQDQRPTPGPSDPPPEPAPASAAEAVRPFTEEEKAEIERAIRIHSKPEEMDFNMLTAIDEL